MADLHVDLVHLVRFLVEDKIGDATAVARRLLRQVAKDRPDLAEAARSLVPGIGGNLLRGTRTPREVGPLPVDADSRLELVRRIRGTEQPVRWPHDVRLALDGVVREREREPELTAAGLVPSRSMLFVGPPGVGKTLAAHDVARRLGRELLVLDLAAVMSSFLGKTGGNIRSVLDFASRSGDVLLLDEFDAIAKRRDDSHDVGELRRLVNVLLQSIDEWPADGLLIAATNHPDLLDPAVWRRFDVIVEFRKPAAEDIALLLGDALGDQLAKTTIEATATILLGASFADITREISRARRTAVLGGESIDSVWLSTLAGRAKELPLASRRTLATTLSERGFSQRRVHDITGISRDTLRKQGKGEARKHGS